MNTSYYHFQLVSYLISRMITIILSICYNIDDYKKYIRTGDDYDGI